MTLSLINNSTFATSSFKLVQNFLEQAKTTLVLKPLGNAEKVRDAALDCRMLCGELTTSATNIGEKFIDDTFQYGPSLATSRAFIRGTCALRTQGGMVGQAVTKYSLVSWIGYGACMTCCGKAKITGAI